MVRCTDHVWCCGAAVRASAFRTSNLCSGPRIYTRSQYTLIYLKEENIRYSDFNDSTCYFSVHKSTSRSSRPLCYILCAGTQSTTGTAGSHQNKFKFEPVREPTPPWFLARSSRFSRPLPSRRPPPRLAARKRPRLYTALGPRSPSNRQSGTRSRCQPLRVRSLLGALVSSRVWK